MCKGVQKSEKVLIDTLYSLNIHSFPTLNARDWSSRRSRLLLRRPVFLSRIYNQYLHQMTSYSPDITSKVARQLDSTVWWGKMDSVTRAYTFHLYPTFFHKGGVFQLTYLDQCTRYAPEVAYSDQPGALLLTGQFAGMVWKARYAGGDLLKWTNDSGKSMTWELTHSDI